MNDWALTGVSAHWLLNQLGTVKLCAVTSIRLIETWCGLHWYVFVIDTSRCTFCLSLKIIAPRINTIHMYALHNFSLSKQRRIITVFITDKFFRRIANSDTTFSFHIQCTLFCYLKRETTNTIVSGISKHRSDMLRADLVVVLSWKKFNQFLILSQQALRNWNQSVGLSNNHF